MGKLSAGLGGEGLAGEFKQRESPLASVGLDRAELEFAADALDLLADLDNPSIEVDVVPAQPEDFAPAQAINDQQHERAVQRISLGCGDEALGFLRRPGTERVAAPFRQFDVPGDVAGDQFLADCPGQGCAQHRSHDLHLADRVTGLQSLVEKHLHGWDRQPGEALGAQTWDEIEADDRLVQRVGGGAPVALDDVFQPVLQVRSDLPRFVGNRDPGAGLMLGPAELVPGFIEGLAVDDDTLAGAGRGAGVEGADPVAVLLAFVDGAVAVDAAAPPGGWVC